MEAALSVRNVEYSYGPRRALAGVSFDVRPGELFAFLGPNGGGKTTLFRLLSTLAPLQTGSITVLGHELPGQLAQVRAALGVVFQSPSVDRHLTVAENIRFHAALFGVPSAVVASRIEDIARRLGLADRLADRVASLSGGLQRRVELAKALLHRPQVLVMDEPSTGLDPGARIDLWRYLRELQAESGLTIVLTTHLLDEADRADRLAILHAGAIVALDAPDALRATVGGDTITIATADAERLAAAVRERFGIAASVVEGRVRCERSEGASWIARLVDAFPRDIDSITLGKPTLEDVFIARTGHRFWTA